MSPNEALYGVKPRQLCLPSDCRTPVASVADFQLQREAMNHVLKESITAAQHRYKYYADKKRTEVSLQEGYMVYLKLQPYRQLFGATRKHLKLAHKYFGPYKVLQKISTVAYKLVLPPGSLVHPVFHISMLKKKIGSNYSATTTLPRLGDEGQFLVYHVNILDRRLVKKNNVAVIQWLVQWSHAIPDDSTWEDAVTMQAQYPEFNP